jgi:hypothetical protein
VWARLWQEGSIAARKTGVLSDATGEKAKYFKMLVSSPKGLPSRFGLQGRENRLLQMLSAVARGMDIHFLNLWEYSIPCCARREAIPSSGFR